MYYDCKINNNKDLKNWQTTHKGFGELKDSNYTTSKGYQRFTAIKEHKTNDGWTTGHRTGLVLLFIFTLPFALLSLASSKARDTYSSWWHGKEIVKLDLNDEVAKTIQSSASLLEPPPKDKPEPTTARKKRGHRRAASVPVEPTIAKAVKEEKQRPRAASAPAKPTAETASREVTKDIQEERKAWVREFDIAIGTGNKEKLQKALEAKLDGKLILEKGEHFNTGFIDACSTKGNEELVDLLLNDERLDLREMVKNMHPGEEDVTVLEYAAEVRIDDLDFLQKLFVSKIINDDEVPLEKFADVLRTKRDQIGEEREELLNKDLQFEADQKLKQWEQYQAFVKTIESRI